MPTTYVAGAWSDGSTSSRRVSTRVEVAAASGAVVGTTLNSAVVFDGLSDGPVTDATPCVPSRAV